MSVLCKITHC